MYWRNKEVKYASTLQVVFHLDQALILPFSCSYHPDTLCSCVPNIWMSFLFSYSSSVGRFRKNTSLPSSRKNFCIPDGPSTHVDDLSAQHLCRPLTPLNTKIPWHRKISFYCPKPTNQHVVITRESPASHVHLFFECVTCWCKHCCTSMNKVVQLHSTRLMVA